MSTAAETQETAHQARRVGRKRRDFCWLRLVPEPARWPDWIRQPPRDNDEREERADG